MDRIIPFGYPTIPGGASGGASVDPTPPSSDDPQPPATLPYNLDNLHIIPNISQYCTQVGNVFVGQNISGSGTVGILSRAKLQGIIPQDLTGVRQINISGPAFGTNGVFTADGEQIPNSKLYNNQGINTTKTITQFLDTDDFSVVIGDVNGYAANMSYSDWNSLCKDKQIVIEIPLTIKVYDTAGEIVQEYETELTL